MGSVCGVSGKGLHVNKTLMTGLTHYACVITHRAPGVSVHGHLPTLPSDEAHAPQTGPPLLIRHTD